MIFLEFMVVMVLKLVSVVVVFVVIVVADAVVVKIGIDPSFGVAFVAFVAVLVPAMSSVGLGRCGRTPKLEHAQNILSGGFTWQNT